MAINAIIQSVNNFLHPQFIAMPFNARLTADYFNSLSKSYLPTRLSIIVTEVKENFIAAEIKLSIKHFSTNGYIHGGLIVSLADTTAGYGCLAHLPEKGVNMTTLELKSNFVSSAKSGTIVCQATPTHLGKTTQLWDVVVSHQQTGR